MKKKIALVLASLLISAALLTTLYITIPATSPSALASPEGPYHWKIELAQKKCNAHIFGYLTDEFGDPIPGTDFDLWCLYEDTPPPPSQRVFAKVTTDILPHDINFTKEVDWNMDGIPDEIVGVDEDLIEPVEGHRWYHHQQEYTLELIPIFPPIDLSNPICNELEEVAPLPGRTYHLSSWEDTGWPYGNLSYCDQVDLTPIAPPGPIDWWHVEDATPDFLLLRKMVVVEVHQTEISHQWQLMVKQHNCNVLWIGDLTNETGDAIPGTNFAILCNCTTLQCTVVRTPNCTIPNDIEFDIIIFSKDDPEMLFPIDVQYHHENITQFPWTMVKAGIDPFTGNKWTVELELTEVQMHRYTVAGGTMDTAGQLGAFASWPLEGWKTDEGVPFATREPYLKAGCMWQNITFTQKDPITGIVKLGVPAESYVGLDHTYWDPRIGTYVRWQISMQEQGCGWIFTGEGKNNITGDVDLITFNNNTGIYSLNPWHEGEPMTPEPCLQNLRGPDGIPGTGDDPIGDGVPDPKGSSILYLPTKLNVTYWDGVAWQLLCVTPFPMLMTTAVAYDIVVEPTSLLDGLWSTEKGHPWRYHVDGLPWKDPECNIKVTYVCSWSKLQIPTTLGLLDLLWEVNEYKVREDRYETLRGDANWDQIVDFKDLYMVCRAFGSRDEDFGRPVADPEYDARCDFNCDGLIDIRDVIVVAKNYNFVPGYHVPDTWQGTISIVPSSPSATVGQTFEVNVTVSGVTDLYLALFCIRWNPAVLNMTKATPGDFIPGVYDVYARIDYAGGYLEAWTGTMYLAVPGVTGSGTVATLEFEVVGTGSSPLDLYNCSWMNSTFGQFGFTTVQDGSFIPSCVFPVTWTWVNYTGVVVNFNANVAISGCCQVVQNFNFTRVRDVNNSTGYISFDVVSPGSPGSCNVTIPKPVMDGGFKVLLNDTVVPSILAWNKSHTFVWFSYPAGTHNVKIVGEMVTRIRSVDLLTLADVNGDGRISISDVVAIALRFGWKEYP